MRIEKSVVNQILDFLNYHETDIHLLGGYFDNVYEISSEVPMIIKIFNKMFDSEEEILSEIEWTQYLKANGVSVTIPKLINGESYVNNLTDNLFFVAYEKAKGVHIDPCGEDWNDKLFRQWGMGMGRMHFLSKMYKGKYKRPEWNEHKIYQVNMNSLDSKIEEKWEKYLQAIKSMSCSKELYEIIHGDLHHHNFLYNNNEITYIDFGDSEFNWFAYDIAIAIYHASQIIKDKSERDKFASQFFESFIEGYSKENSVGEIVKHVDFFINFRHVYSFVYHHHFLQIDQLNRQQMKYLEEMKQTIVNQDTYLGKSLV
ncbi:hypothetical protein EHV15_26245 [Paenibacillus oralis]|uniref:Aminoglycoside phosphotransferase domain-containing protein n=1 Tax=Paenibacillus oralis TaxID=2490856 RepID=A0A3P3U6X1_9BACL|nr:phosphotransferase [Paenibacillus oralis]RRJ66025.1 hypothetical protein EHV15_26245 [Paenibacillus oralis]